MAADQRCHTGDLIAVSGPKIRKFGAMVVGIAGDYAAAVRFFDWIERGMRGRVPATRDLEILVGEAGKLEDWHALNGKLIRAPITAPFAAIGSGQDIAKGAMYAGAGAVKAVRAAIEFDPKSGNGILSLRYG